MTNNELKHAAAVLMNSYQLIGSTENPKYLPKVFVVKGKCYFFLNVAKRAAFGTSYPIEVLTIEDAILIHTNTSIDAIDKYAIDRDFDQTGSTYDGRLFDNRKSIYADMVKNPIIPLVPTP